MTDQPMNQPPESGEPVPSPAPKRRGRPRKVKPVAEETLFDQTEPAVASPSPTAVSDSAPAIPATPVETGAVGGAVSEAGGAERPQPSREARRDGQKDQERRFRNDRNNDHNDRNDRNDRNERRRNRSWRRRDANGGNNNNGNGTIWFPESFYTSRGSRISSRGLSSARERNPQTASSYCWGFSGFSVIR